MPLSHGVAARIGEGERRQPPQPEHSSRNVEECGDDGTEQRTDVGETTTSSRYPIDGNANGADQPPSAPDRSCKSANRNTMPGNRPSTKVPTPQIPSAAQIGAGTSTGDVSPSGTGFIQISRSTRM